MKHTFKNLTSDEAITWAIHSVHRRSDSLQLDVQRVLVGIAAQWVSSGDVRPAVKHVNMLLTKGQLGGLRCNAIREWVETFLGMIIVEDGDNKGQFVKGAMKSSAINMKDVIEKRWFDFKPEPAYKPMDFEKQFKVLMAKAEKRSEVAKDEDNVDVGLLAALKVAADEYRASLQ